MLLSKSASGVNVNVFQATTGVHTTVQSNQPTNITVSPVSASVLLNVITMFVSIATSSAQ